jgi:cytochrome c-type biogenesis protein CcmH
MGLLALALAGCVSEEVPSSPKAVEERLTCQCGCGLTVHTCNHLQCSFGVPVKKDVADSLAAGQTGEQILARYVAKYGEKILSSPTAQGFNLLAWYGPYIALVVGGLVLVVMLRRWRRDIAPPEPAPELEQPLSDQQRRRLDSELETLER